MKYTFKKILTTAVLSASITSAASAAYATTNKDITIGIIAPIDIAAMHEITNGFTQQLAKEFPHNKHIKVVIKNAESDPELMHAIISQLAKRDDINIVAPIGTATFQNTAALIKNKPILGIAAELSETTRAQLANKQTTDVIDEIDVAKQLQFTHKIMPNLKHITIIHSINAKIADEVDAFNKQAIKEKIQVQDLAIPQASDLYSISKHINSSSQAVFILKDEMIVGGMPTIVNAAEKKNIAVIASDDGSVQNGAAFALGVRESDIGVASAKIAAKEIRGLQFKNIPITKLTHYTVFINSAHSSKQGLDNKKIKQSAKESGYSLAEEGNHG